MSENILSSKSRKFSFVEKFFKIEPENQIGRLSFFLRILLLVVLLFALSFILFSILAYFASGAFIYFFLSGGSFEQMYTMIAAVTGTISFTILLFPLRPLIVKRIRSMGYKGAIPNILLWTYLVVHIIFCVVVIVLSVSNKKTIGVLMDGEIFQNFATFMVYYLIYLSQSRIVFMVLLIILFFIPPQKIVYVDSSEK